MNFLAPEMLLGLLLIPIAIGFYLWAQRRRQQVRGPLHEPGAARRTSPPSARRGAATCRPPCTSAPSPRCSSAWLARR